MCALVAPGTAFAQTVTCPVQVTETRRITLPRNYETLVFDDQCKNAALVSHGRIDFLSVETQQIISGVADLYSGYDVDFSPDGRTLYAVGRSENVLLVIDVQTGAITHSAFIVPQQGKNPDIPLEVAVTAANQVLISTQQDTFTGRVLEYRPSTKTFTHLLSAGGPPTAWTRHTTLAATRDRRAIIASSSDGSFRFASGTGAISRFSLPDNGIPPAQRGEPDIGGSFHMMSGMVINSRLQPVHRFGGRYGSDVFRLNPNGRVAYQFSSNSAGQPNFLKVYNTRTGIVIGQIPLGDRDDLGNMKLSPDGAMIALLHRDTLLLMPSMPSSPPVRTIVYAGKRAEMQSYIRLHNTSDLEGQVRLSLADATTGASVGVPVLYQVPANAVAQVGISALEPPGMTTEAKPSQYVLTAQAVTASYSGTLQHVVWRPADRTLSSVPTCSAGVTATPSHVSFVRSSAQHPDYQSTVIIQNPDSRPWSVAVTVYSAETGQKLGHNANLALPGTGPRVLSASQLEAEVGIRNAAVGHYVVVLDEPGYYLHHQINNQASGVMIDSSVVCSLSGERLPFRSNEWLGSINSSRDADAQPVIRIINPAMRTGGHVGLEFYGPYGTAAVDRVYRAADWMSAYVAPRAALEFPLSEIERAMPAQARELPHYGVDVGGVYARETGHTDFEPRYQSLMVYPQTYTITNLTACPGATADPRAVAGVQTALMHPYGSSSAVTLVNTGTLSAPAVIGVYDANIGIRLGTYTSDSIPAGGAKTVSVDEMDARIVRSFEYLQYYPVISIEYRVPAKVFHYVLRIESAFTGYIQNIVENPTGIAVDFGTYCPMSR